MARAAGEHSGLERWLFQLGYASERVHQALQGVREAAAGIADRAAATTEELESELEGAWGEDAIEDVKQEVGSLAATTALGVIAAQLLKPRPVNWPRAIVAGTIGTLVYDAETLVEARLRGRKFGTRTHSRPAAADESIATLLARYAAGIGMAAFYARYLYGRLPGPPLVQGVTYGVLESTTRAWGGAMSLLNRLSPEIRLPTGYTSGLARGSESPLEALGRHAAFGAALGLVYRRK
jgi:hypothetical protein